MTRTVPGRLDYQHTKPAGLRPRARSFGRGAESAVYSQPTRISAALALAAAAGLDVGDLLGLLVAGERCIETTAGISGLLDSLIQVFQGAGRRLATLAAPESDLGVVGDVV